MSEPQSPLAEPTIQELFALPQEEQVGLPDAQIDRIIDAYRADRHTWNAKDSAKRAAKGAPKPEKGSITQITLDDLGL